MTYHFHEGDDSPCTPLYGHSVADALSYAATAHACQLRKGKPHEPYLTHLLRVSQLALRYRYPESPDADAVVIAGALHDTAEDQGGEVRLRDIAWRFGPRVAEIVEACSDSVTADPENKAPYPARKRHHIASVDATDDAGIALVTVCDKIANLEEVLEDLAPLNPDEREKYMLVFKGRVEGTAAYYRGMYRATSSTAPPKASAHLRRLVVQLYEVFDLDVASIDDASLPPSDQFYASIEADIDDDGNYDGR